jgi:hypothetical protein
VHLRFKAWQLAALQILICAGAITGFYFYRNSGGYGAGEMASYLPLGDGALVYIDVDAMRRSGVLDLIAGKKAAADLEYQSFLDQTKFDYRDDLDAVVALFKGDQVFMTVRGRFDWKSLMRYANRHGGSCTNGFCTTEGSKPERRISFYPIRSDLMGLAVSRDGWAAYEISRKTGRLPVDPPHQPVWAILTGPMLKNLTSLPSGTGPFTAALENAGEMVFTASEQGGQFELGVKVICQTPDKASLLLNELQMNTDRLRRKFSEEHKEANPDDLSGILSAGTFRREEREVIGLWPVRRAFVEAVAGGEYRQ